MNIQPVEHHQTLAVASTPVRDALRERTLAKLGQVMVQAGPMLELLRAPADDPDRVGRAIQRCPGLATRLLAVTNSAAYRTGNRIGTVHRAVIQLGAARARTIALAFGLRMLTEQSQLPAPLVKQLWIASLHKAVAAQLMARQIDPREADAAFCLGLMQDIGLPLLVAVDPSFYAHEIASDRTTSWTERERQRFGIDHAEVGARLLEGWSADAELVQTVRQHHHLPHDVDAERAAARLPAFFASLLPHLNEEPTAAQREWLISLHAKFLTVGYASPARFLEAVGRDAVLLYGSDTAQPPALKPLLHSLTRAVAGEAIGLISQLYRLENTLGRQREDLEELRCHAFTDPLTKVLNRRGFAQLAARRTETAPRRGRGVCCLMIDLDDLKPINDTFGHDAGDALLRRFAKRLRRCVDRGHLIGRLGGDEFAVLLVDVDEAAARRAADQLMQGCQGAMIRLGDEDRVPLSFSLGAVHVDAAGAQGTLDELMQAADEAMFQAKRSGKGRLVFASFQPPSTARAARLIVSA